MAVFGSPPSSARASGGCSVLRLLCLCLVLQFLKDELRCVAATVAFGMGIDKPDIRMVVHYGMSKNVESYAQQIGRAGRDGLKCICILFTSSADLSTIVHLLVRSTRQREMAFSPAVRANEPLNASSSSYSVALWQLGSLRLGAFATSCPVDALPRSRAVRFFEQQDSIGSRSRSAEAGMRAMYKYSQLTLTCRRKWLLAFFGEELSVPCSGCDICDMGDGNPARRFLMDYSQVCTRLGLGARGCVAVSRSVCLCL